MPSRRSTKRTKRVKRSTRRRQTCKQGWPKHQTLRGCDIVATRKSGRRQTRRNIHNAYDGVGVGI